MYEVNLFLNYHDTYHELELELPQTVLLVIVNKIGKFNGGLSGAPLSLWSSSGAPVVL